MTKKCLLALALTAVPSLGSVAAAQADETVGSTLKVKYKEADASDPYGMSAFKGAVGPKECAKGRKVTIKGLGTEKTTSKGKFEFTLSGPADPGKYKVKVAAKDIGDGVTCAKVKTTLTIAKAG